jgi:hypothetical protein
MRSLPRSGGYPAPGSRSRLHRHHRPQCQQFHRPRRSPPPWHPRRSRQQRLPCRPLSPWHPCWPPQRCPHRGVPTGPHVCRTNHMGHHATQPTQDTVLVVVALMPALTVPTVPTAAPWPASAASASPFSGTAKDFGFRTPSSATVSPILTSEQIRLSTQPLPLRPPSPPSTPTLLVPKPPVYQGPICKNPDPSVAPPTVVAYPDLTLVHRWRLRQAP